MIDNGFIFAKNNKRIFINTSLGCLGQCSYCYLTKFGYSNKQIKEVISVEKIIEILDKNKLDINNETLISLGCFSECWDENNKDKTINLIKYFLKKGNQIQLSTKRQILKDEIIEILPLIKYYGQLVIFISSATISKWSVFEKNTTDIFKRLESFLSLNKLNIPAVLYIKPVLKDITINDLEIYRKNILKYNIKDVVVGSFISEDISDETIPFSSKNKFFYKKNNDEDLMISNLSEITNVYSRSTEIMYKYKKSVNINTSIK